MGGWLEVAGGAVMVAVAWGVLQSETLEFPAGEVWVSVSDE